MKIGVAIVLQPPSGLSANGWWVKSRFRKGSLDRWLKFAAMNALARSLDQPHFTPPPQSPFEPSMNVHSPLTARPSKVVGAIRFTTPPMASEP